MTIYLCDDDRRRQTLIDPARNPAALNGIDYLEVLDQAAPPGLRQQILHVSFVNSPAPVGIAAPNVQIAGGERVTDIQVTSASLSGDTLVVQVSEPGDFSEYTLRLVDSAGNEPYPGLDPVLSQIPFSFKVECPTDFDCQTTTVCAPQTPAPPDINYLTKDFATFVTLMQNRVSLLSPAWRERSPADIGVTLVELLAYVADRLSYRQDAIATEAYLATARQRISVRRHARLVDYVIQEGCNARAWVCVHVTADVTLPAGTEFLTRVPGASTTLAPGSLALAQARQQGPQSFRSMRAATLRQLHNQMPFHAWGGDACCLPAGATSATLRGAFPQLSIGDVLVFQETRGRYTGNTDDADPSRRVAVRLTSVAMGTDPIGKAFDPSAPGVGPLAITEISWGAEDALPFSIQISETILDPPAPDQRVDSAFAYGNVVLVDHGRAASDVLRSPPAPSLVSQPHTTGTPAPVPTPPPFSPVLSQAPLTHAAPLAADASAAATFTWSMADVMPQVSLTSTSPLAPSWVSVGDLLESLPGDAHFVVEIDNASAAHLRFGDGEYGMTPDHGITFTASYRIGNGTAGNVGAGAIAHVVWTDPAIETLGNPIASSGGVDPEALEHVRQSAPFAFRTQLRAVTPADYASWLDQRSDVQRAAATFRWTGSWYTVFDTVERKGLAAVDAPYKQTLEAYLERYRVVGKDLEIDTPRFVALDIAANVCVKPGYFRGDVLEALRAVFSSQPGGVFDPANFDFGQTVYLSPLYAAAQSVTGVDSIEFTQFEPRGFPWRSGLQAGSIPMGRLEIGLVSNDPSFPERGQIAFTMQGGQ